ncbi:GWxTD domain-containing protein [Dyadobacter jejuensis]|uniref:GWxTD domain-containing protein n=1 Tax=Dyadobacter jejuensis TaxID=1082580 RepID=A0A316AD84_9BACT|nr:GWxTD domain-containing protein [Dyadobacter jejuensis]PWJ55591.1 GWxTD domain-containing protein [Dyadobacter jejuensis]
MKNNIGFLIAVLAAVFSGCSSSQAPSRQIPDAQVRAMGMAAAEAPDELALLAVKSQYLLQDSTKTRVFLYVDAYKGKQRMSVSEFLNSYNLNYVIYSDYGTRDRLGYGNVKLSTENVAVQEKKLVIQFEFDSPKRESGVLLSELSQIGTLKKVLNDLTIPFKQQQTNDLYAVFPSATQFPLERHFVRTNETVRLLNLEKSSQPLQVFYYRHDFDPAGSPMNTSPKAASKTLSVDSIFTIQSTQELQFTREGLYNIFADTTQKEGLGLLVVNDRFPKTTQPELLLEPLLYMSTNTEINEIQKAEDYKKALDTYWLTLMNGNAPLAKQTIQNYYARVEDANALFTTYKEGWKTDKGMIFIVLGPPDKVQRSKDKEVWTYNQRGNAQNVNFTFNRRNNQFVDDHYELVRYAEYQPIWYPVVEAWRNGIIR